MGQYYKVLMGKDEKITICHRMTDGIYVTAKLMEDAWWKDRYVASITEMLYKNTSRVAWVGDFIDASDFPTGCKHLSNTYALNVKSKDIDGDELYLDGKCLVNHTKKVYLNCDDYKLRSNNCGCVIHPLPLLTAIGNGLGGGDYYGINTDDVGTWAWNEISVENKPPVGYTEVKYTFLETFKYA